MSENSEKVLRNRRRKRDYLANLKDVPCADCGQRYPFFVMDFDHVRGEKKFNLSRVASVGHSWAVIIEEAAKCDVVCANCHRIRTHTRVVKR